jgi:hypothetical protein
VAKQSSKCLSLEQISFLLSGLHITLDQAKGLADGKILPSKSHLIVLMTEPKWDVSKVLTNQFTLSELLLLTQQEDEEFKERKAEVTKMLGEKIAYALNNRLDTFLFTLEDLGKFTEKETTFILNSLTSSGFVRCQTYGYSHNKFKQYKFGLPGLLNGIHY